MIVIEMNPRVSRSSALASKATGFPIAKIAAKLAVGYTLDEIQNDITRETPACFEPTIDYVRRRRSRASPSRSSRGADATLTTQMKSVGEAMAIGRTFKEALQKALRGLETGRPGFGLDRARPGRAARRPTASELDAHAARPERATASWPCAPPTAPAGAPRRSTRRPTIDPWFLENIRELVEFEQRARAARLLDRGAPARGQAARLLRRADRASPPAPTPRPSQRCARSTACTPIYKLVDTCAAEFEAVTPYYYSTCEDESEVRAVRRSARS